MSILVVGAGFSGAVIARELAEAGKRVDVIDARHHVGGNAFDYINAWGIRVHKYGPHLFHTKHKDIWDWVSKYTAWLSYQHRVKALLSDGHFVTLPPNRETRRILGSDKAVIDTLFRPYSRKMWGMELEEMDPSIVARIPLRDDDNELYFPNDPFQGMPAEGYTAIFQKILDHPNISVRLNTQFQPGMEKVYEHVFNSAAIDLHYGYIFGDLPYRSIKFRHYNIPTNSYAPCLNPAPVINFTDDGPVTRVTEWKQIPGHGSNDYLTTLTEETPCDYRDNDRERYYPVKDVSGKNQKAYLKYLAHSKRESPNMTFIGRCGLYQYLDMDQAIATALNIVKKYLATS